jgi:hypothetical protein
MQPREPNMSSDEFRDLLKLNRREAIRVLVSECWGHMEPEAMLEDIRAVNQGDIRPFHVLTDDELVAEWKEATQNEDLPVLTIDGRPVTACPACNADLTQPGAVSLDALGEDEESWWPEGCSTSVNSDGQVQDDEHHTVSLGVGLSMACAKCDEDLEQYLEGVEEIDD